MEALGMSNDKSRIYNDDELDEDDDSQQISTP